MRQDWVLHNSQLRQYRSPFGAVSCKETITLKIRLMPEAEADAVVLRLWMDEQREEKITMTSEFSDDGTVLYQATVSAGERPGLIWYYFIIHAGGSMYYYGNHSDGLGGEGQLSEQQPPSFQITVYKQGVTTPDWFKDAIMYQIMPDRFYNGEPEHAILHPKPGSLLHSHWDNTPYYVRDADTKEVVAYDFFGGNLSGIQAKLPYLKELGITVIYLNPIFESPSNHRYDTADYHKVDAMLGDEPDFAALCAEAEQQGISIILDGVFSHTGSDSIYFNKEGHYPEPGAYQSQQSPYFPWYRFNTWPDRYDCWWSIASMPDVNETEPSYLDFVITGENSVVRHWAKCGIKGWRLDVVDELPSEFVRKFRITLKEINPEAVLIGEVWEDASHKVSYGEMRHYLGGEELDSAMNYPFRSIVLDFMLGQVDAQQTHRRLMSLYENYPRQHFYAMMNLVGSHDVPRILTALGEAPPSEIMHVSEQARYALPPENRRLGVARLKLVVLWQMTFPGVPCIYYGDEAGVEGYKDPFNRKTYPWGSEDGELLAWYKKLTGLRREYAALATGEWHLLYADGDVYGYVRRIMGGKDVFGRPQADRTLLVLFNRSASQPVEVGINVRPWCHGTLVDVLSGDEVFIDKGMLTVTLKQLEGKLYIQKEESAFARECGILLHPTSLPSRYGIGDLGKEAYEFINFLYKGKQKLWQILPLNPPGVYESPYQCLSAFAGNHLLISLGKLVSAGLLTVADVKGYPVCDADTVEFVKVKANKERLLRIAFARFNNHDKLPAYRSFVAGNGFWLEDYALFMALKQYFRGIAWNKWPQDVASRQEAALDYYREILSETIEYHKFLQYLFFSQWQAIRQYANRWGIKIIGDLPLFVAHDSSDVWSHPHLFQLDETGMPAKAAGVPPDYFSKTGQLWGNPLYNWEEMAKDDYKWWRERIELLLKTVDIIRIDHFRGFAAYWEVPAGEETAVNGKWTQGPGGSFFATLRKYLGPLPVIAEDLGVITPDVEDLKHEFGFPGMKVLQFAFEHDETGALKPVACEKNSVVYTGTHDNDTTAGWYDKLVLADAEMAGNIAELLQLAPGSSGAAVCRALVEYAYAGNANTAVIPLQDVLALGSEARMNTPGTVGGNWCWRSSKAGFTPEAAAWLAGLAEKYRR